VELGEHRVPGMGPWRVQFVSGIVSGGKRPVPDYCHENPFGHIRPNKAP